MKEAHELAAGRGDGTLPPPFIGGTLADGVWQLSVPAKAAIRSITWSSFELDDGSPLTAQKNIDLLDGCKLYVVLFALGKTSGRRTRGGTILSQLYSLISLVCWMNSVGLRSFRDLTVTRAASYRNHLMRPTSGRGYRLKGQRIAPGTVRQRLAIIRNLATLQEDMGEVGTSFSRREMNDLDALLRTDVEWAKPTPCIPDTIFMQLIEAAISRIDEDWPKIKKLLAAYETHKKTRRLGMQNNRPHPFSKTAQQFIAPDETIELNKVSRTVSSLSHHEVHHLAKHVRSACLIIIAGLVGMRESEIGSLQLGCLKRVTMRGGAVVLKLAGRLYKTARSDDGEAAEWVAGYDEASNPVRRAIEVLEELPRMAGNKSLFAPIFQQSGRAPSRIGACTVREGLGAFATDCGIVNWVFSPHQFRKTFARFVALAGGANAYAIMRHFKHVSVIMTEGYLRAHDPEMLADIFEASQAIVAERLDSIFGAERLGGVAGQRISKNNRPFRGASNAEARRELVELTMKDPNAHVRPMPYGVCIYESSTAKCKGEAANIGLDTCVGCYNFVVDPEHNLQFWQEYRASIEHALTLRRGFNIVDSELDKRLEAASRIVLELSEEANGREA